MPEAIVEMVAEALNSLALAVRGSRVLIVGVAYKRDVADVRESPSIDIIDSLERRGAHVEYLDQHVPTLGNRRSIEAITETYNCSVIVADHAGVDYEGIAARSSVVIDTRGALRGRCRNVITL
jgi:UDP-N-acetyl-D-glucosamine dehydrogenase